MKWRETGIKGTGSGTLRLPCLPSISCCIAKAQFTRYTVQAYDRPTTLLEELTISQNWPARPVYSRTEFRCQSDLSCQISQCINIIHCCVRFVGKMS